MATKSVNMACVTVGFQHFLMPADKAIDKFILDNAKKEPMAGRVFGPVPREVGEAGFQKIISLAPEVV